MKKFASLVPVLLIILFSSFEDEKKSTTAAYPFDVKISGNGARSIIFIPGFACSGDVWNETKLNFEKDYTCLTLTMPGFARIAPQPNATFKNWEKGIVDYIKENKIEKPILVGHSMGGG